MYALGPFSRKKSVRAHISYHYDWYAIFMRGLFLKAVRVRIGTYTSCCPQLPETEGTKKKEISVGGNHRTIRILVWLFSSVT